jgi:hypothetical protein
MKYCQRLPISYLLLVLIPALVVPFAYSDDKKKAAQQNRSAKSGQIKRVHQCCSRIKA